MLSSVEDPPFVRSDTINTSHTENLLHVWKSTSFHNEYLFLPHKTFRELYKDKFQQVNSEMVA